MNFDDYAKKWDTEKRITRAKVIADEIVSSIGINENYSVMEFGCGTGLISFNLFENFKKVTLVDTSKGMLDIVRDKIHKYNANNMVTIYSDITREHLINEKFDMIYSSMVLHHVKDITATINKFYELLNKGGFLCIVDLNEDDGSFHRDQSDFDGHNGFNQEKLASILCDSGFTYVESKTFFWDDRIIEGSKMNYSLFLMKATK